MSWIFQATASFSNHHGVAACALQDSRWLVLLDRAIMMPGIRIHDPIPHSMWLVSKKTELYLFFLICTYTNVYLCVKIEYIYIYIHTVCIYLYLFVFVNTEVCIFVSMCFCDKPLRISLWMVGWSSKFWCEQDDGLEAWAMLNTPFGYWNGHIHLRVFFLDS